VLAAALGIQNSTVRHRPAAHPPPRPRGGLRSRGGLRRRQV